jgi:hypothetical protein
MSLDEYCLERALAPLLDLPLAGSKVGRAAVVILIYFFEDLFKES